MSLNGKTALVTGAGSGIGRAIALTCIREGARVVVADVDDEGGHQTVKQIEKLGGRAIYHHVDVTKPDDHFALVDAAKRAFGALHATCNNAGVSLAGKGRPLPIAAVTPAEWSLVIDVNLSGVFYGLRAQIPALVEAGGGSIVNIASIFGQVANAGSGPYVPSKHGVVGLTQVAALDYASQGIRVNAVGPGYVETSMLRKVEQPVLAEIKRRHPTRPAGPARGDRRVGGMAVERPGELRHRWFLSCGRRVSRRVVGWHG